MSSSRKAKLEAELALVEAEEDFVAKKKAGTLTAEDKLALRVLRQEFREKHRSPKPGASPAPIGATRKKKKGA